MKYSLLSISKLYEKCNYRQPCKNSFQGGLKEKWCKYCRRLVFCPCACTVVHQKHPTGLCEHCGEEESVEHVICVCQKYTNEREIMKNERWEWIN